MKRSKKLNPVLDVASKATESALLKVGEASALWQAEKQQLEDLHNYKGEYLAKFRQSDTLTMSAQKVLELRAFLAQLDQAIEAQVTQVEQYYQAVQYQQQLWLEARTREQAMQSLVTRYQTQEADQEAKQEQRDNDERNTSLWYRKSR